MFDIDKFLSRRAVLRGGVSLGATMAFFTTGVFAEHLDLTPPLTEGPFYPYGHLPLNPDNDLIVVNDATTPLVGAITQLTGRILDAEGTLLKDATMEIWQCDATGVYLAEGDDRRDKHFKGYGRFTTGSEGAYRFRTIKPVPYTGRPAPHIHVKIERGGQELLTTQLFIAGYAGNKNDGVFRGTGDAFERELVSADFVPIKGSKIGELSANIDIVVGRTPADRHEDKH
jgi:protocatechuate 3,4-dioxygenase beta subunit